MNDFTYSRAKSVSDAVHDRSRHQGSRFIAGGTNLLDLLKVQTMQAERLIDINHIELGKIEATKDGGLRLGASATNAETAYHPEIERRYPLLSKAILAGASPQLRNMATNAGNLLQRTRCYYFYDIATPCNKRSPGSGCGALHGVNRIHAILGASDSCIAVHPSDMCVALAALEARVQIEGANGSREIEFKNFHRLPGDTPELDTNLKDNEIIIGIDLPKRGFAMNYAYIKARERNSYAFALVSAAVALEIDNGVVSEARIAVGGVAHKPWRSTEAEDLLVGQKPERRIFIDVANKVLDGARGYGENNFKLPLAQRVIVRALEEAATLGTQS